MLGEYAPLISVTVTAALTAYVFVARHLTAKKLTEQSQALQAVKQELVAVSNGSIGMGRKLMSLEKQIAELKNSQEEMVRNDPNRVSYTEASRLVELGAEVEDLMNSCGISRPEAELVTALSQRNQLKEITVN